MVCLVSGSVFLDAAHMRARHQRVMEAAACMGYARPYLRGHLQSAGAWSSQHSELQGPGEAQAGECGAVGELQGPGGP